METGNAQGTTTGVSGGAADGAGGGAQGGTQNQNGAGGESALVAAAAAGEAAKNADAGKQAADAKAAADAAAKAAAPLDLKLPDGLDAKHAAVAPALESIRNLAKEAKFSAEQAQKVVDAYGPALKAAVAQAEQLQKIEAERKEWPAQLRADKEIGGANYDASMKLAGQALTQFGGKDLAALMQAHGLGDNPLLVKFCVRVGKALGEDSGAGTNNDAPPIPDAEAKLRARYPSMAKS